MTIGSRAISSNAIASNAKYQVSVSGFDGITSNGVTVGATTDAAVTRADATTNTVSLGYSADASVVTLSGQVNLPSSPTSWTSEVGVTGTWTPDTPATPV